MKKYYTYAYLREDRKPYYIGKGKGNRAYSKNHKINPPVDKDRIIFLKKNLSEKEALKHEVYMIFVFGRKNLGTGILYNMTNGGEGVSGLKHTIESKRRIGAASKGHLVSQKQREEIRKSKLGNTWNRGRKISEDQKNKIRNTLIGVKHTAERRKNQSLAKMGVKHTSERNALKSALQKGKKWYNNGEINKFSHYCPDGFVLGMMKRK